MKRKPKVGETLFLVINRQRGHTEALPVVIDKVGNKYFYLTAGNKDLKFELETWRQVSGYCNAHTLYEEEQVYLDKEELSGLLCGIRSFFNGYGATVSLEAARKIKKIIEGEK